MTHRYLVLGPVQVRDPQGRQVRISEHKVRALLAMLLANANTPVSTGALIEVLWGDRPPRSAAANLQTYVWKLRHWVGRDELERDPGGYRLRVAPDDVDATRCAALAQLGRRQLDDGAAGAAIAALCDAAALCRGEPFEGAPEVTNKPFVLRLREQCRTLGEDLVEARLRLGQHATVVPDLVVLTTEAPYRERQWAQLMLALHRCGRRAEALAAYQRVHRILTTELGIQPGVQLRELQSAILREEAVDDHKRWLVSRHSSRSFHIFLSGHYGSESAWSTLLAVHTNSPEFRPTVRSASSSAAAEAALESHSPPTAIPGRSFRRTGWRTTASTSSSLRCGPLGSPGGIWHEILTHSVEADHLACRPQGLGRATGPPARRFVSSLDAYICAAFPAIRPRRCTRSAVQDLRILNHVIERAARIEGCHAEDQQPGAGRNCWLAG